MAAPATEKNRQINRKTVEKAVKSLLKWRRKNPKPSSNQQDDDFFYLVLSLTKIPHRSLAVTQKIPLPHSLLSKSPSLCLIIDDKHKKKPLTKNDAEKKIKSENIPISHVFKLSKLKSDYRTPEKKRDLRESYDIFLADESVVSNLSGFLGKKKVPVPLDLKERDWTAQIERAICCTLLCLSGGGNCFVVRVADVAMMSVNEIVENVVAACEGIAHVVPSKWRNVRSFHLKLLESVSFPIYQADSDMGFH